MGRIALALPLALAACAPGTLTSGADGGGDDLGAAARAAFDEDVKPLLDSFCSGCHVSLEPTFLKPEPDVYTSVTSWPGLVDFARPSNSRLLTKGQHDGPAWTTDQKPVILAWLELEAEARDEGGAEQPETTAFTPVIGENTVSLDELGLSGATITFNLEKLQAGFYVSRLMANAGADGLHLLHPLFVTWVDGQAYPDPVDRFADVDLTLEPDASGMIGGGTAVMVDVPPDAQLSLHFEMATTADGGGGGGGDGGGDGGLDGGCKDVESFTANAQPTLSANCVGCHGGGNAGATGATDMTMLNDLSPEAQANACAQILSRVNLADPPNSGIFVAPDPNSGTGHPFKFNGDAGAFGGFRDALLVWIASEQ